MGIWHDIQKGKAPWRPKLSFGVVAKRLAFSVLFLVFGFVVLYFVATCEISLQRTGDRHVNAVVTKRYLGVPLYWSRLSHVTKVYVESEMRMVEKLGTDGASKSTTSLNEASVSRIVLVGGLFSSENQPASQFRYSLDAEHHAVSGHLNDFLRKEDLKTTTQSIPYAGSTIPPMLAIIFTLGLGGFVFVSVFVDLAIWWIQKQYQKQQAKMHALPNEPKARN